MMAMHDHINELLGIAFARSFYLSNELLVGHLQLDLPKEGKEKRKSHRTIW